MPRARDLTAPRPGRRALLLGLAASAWATTGRASGEPSPGPTPVPGRDPAPGRARIPARAPVQAPLSAPAAGFDPDADLRNLRVHDLREDGRRFLLVTPRWQSSDAPVPLVVFLHGLGETGDERLGAYAWLERYGLGGAWQRLKRTPLARTTKRADWTDARLAEVNAELAARPFRGFAMACPFMPSPKGAAGLDAYARWIERSLLPRCRREARVFEEPARTGLAGVSLGGWVALELLLRLPRAFGAWAGVQTAIGSPAARSYAERLARTDGERASMLLLTSTEDPFRAPTEALSSALAAKEIAHTQRTIPGPHDQPWLREAGTIETVHWLDRALDPAP